MAQAAGIEPATNRLTAGCSTAELRLNSRKKAHSIDFEGICQGLAGFKSAFLRDSRVVTIPSRIRPGLSGEPFCKKRFFSA